MRILKVVQAYYPFQEQGGPVVKVRALARGLVQRGHEVTVLTADLGLGGRAVNGTKYDHCQWGWCSDQDGVKVIYLPTRGHYRALTLNPRVIGFCRASLRGFDLVHFYGLYDLIGPVTGTFCRNQGIPYIIEPMGMYHPIDRGFLLKRMWHRLVGTAFWRNAAQIVATSEMEQQELLAAGVPPAKLVVRYNGINLSEFADLPARGTFRTKWNIPPQQPLILFLSRLIPRKGADMLIEAFASSCPKSGHLVIAGPEGERGYRAYLEDCARNSGVESRVTFTGPLYDGDKQALLADSDLFVLPSRYENFANAPAEAIACGVPVIITNACGIRSLVDGRTGLVIPPEKGALTESLSTLLHDTQLYAQFKANCRAVADELSWSRLTEQMEGYYSIAMAQAQTNGTY
jgi:glycosyltransferase involved in cell wall biosynthesis